MYIICFLVCQAEPRGLIARRVTEVAQSTLDMVSTAVDYPLCECSHIRSLSWWSLCSLRKQCTIRDETFADDFSIFRLCEGRSQARLLGTRPGHHSVPPVL